MRIGHPLRALIGTSLPRSLAVILALFGAGMVLVTRLGGAEQKSAATARHRRFAWPSGERYRYAIRWDGTSSRTLGGGDQAGGVSGGALFDGEVSLRSLGQDDEGTTTLVYGIEDVREYTLHLGDDELISLADRKLAAAALRGQEAFVRVDELGVVRSVAYHRETAASTRELLSQLVKMMRVTFPAEEHGATWTAKEPTPNGMARVRYDDDGDVIRRMRISYEGVVAAGMQGEADQRMSSKARIEMDPKGVLRSLDDEEELDVRQDDVAFVSRWSFTARLAGEDAFDVGTVLRGDLDEGAGAGDLARERQRGRDERLAAGWNLGMIEIQLLMNGNGERVDPTFVARAAAHVRLNADSPAHLAAFFEDRQLTDLGRELTLDVLSAAGSDEAEEAMRAALSSKAVTLSSATRGALVQRFVFVAHPSPESARFVAETYDRARANGDTALGYAAAVTLGAIVEHMEGSDALAAELDGRLRRDLAERRAQGWTVALLRALGNARQEDDLPAIAAFTGDTNSQVRTEVARSLRRFDDPVATRSLLQLTTDRAAPVGRSAFRGLREQTLEDQDWDALARDVEAGQTSPAADGALVDLLERRPDAAARADRMLRFVLARTSDTEGTRDLRARIETLLGRAAQ